MTMKVFEASQYDFLDLPVTRLYNLGSATRTDAEAGAHQGEVAAAGIAISFEIPAPRIYPISVMCLTSETEVGVQGPHTSGEVEIVTVDFGGRLYVGVGSDHTDRDLERSSIVWSKQVCPNVVAPELWSWADVSGHWDECHLEMDVDGQPYQRFPVNLFQAPPDLVRVVRERATVPDGGAWVFGGTGPSLKRKFVFGTQWSFRLVDSRLGRQIEYQYRVSNLLAETNDPFRVPLFKET